MGTFIATNSGLAGLVVPGMSAYSISKLASQRLVEFLDTGLFHYPFCGSIFVWLTTYLYQSILPSDRSPYFQEL